MQSPTCARRSPLLLSFCALLSIPKLAVALGDSASSSHAVRHVSGCDAAGSRDPRCCWVAGACQLRFEASATWTTASDPRTTGATCAAACGAHRTQCQLNCLALTATTEAHDEDIATCKCLVTPQVAHKAYVECLQICRAAYGTCVRKCDRDACPQVAKTSMSFVSTKRGVCVPVCPVPPYAIPTAGECSSRAQTQPPRRKLDTVSLY